MTETSSAAGNTHTPNSVTENLHEIEVAQIQMTNIQKSLHSVLESMDKQQSVFTWMSNTWGGLSIWIKIILGSLIFGGMLATGMLAHYPVLVAVSCICAVVYTLISLTLDNHYSTEKVSRDNLKEGITNLANTLYFIINSLSKIQKKLANEIDRLVKENSELAKNNLIFKEQNIALTNANLKLDTTIDALKRVKVSLETINDDLKIKEQVFKDELQKLTTQNQELALLVKHLSEIVISDTASRQKFNEEFEVHLKDYNNNNNSFAKALRGLFDVETKLHIYTEKLTEQTHKYQQLLERYEKLVSGHEVKSPCNLKFHQEEIIELIELEVASQSPYEHQLY